MCTCGRFDCLDECLVCFLGICVCSRYTCLLGCFKVLWRFGYFERGLKKSCCGVLRFEMKPSFIVPNTGKIVLYARQQETPEK